MTVRRNGMRCLAAGFASFVMFNALVRAHEIPSATLVHVQSHPVIDGDVSDACWRACQALSMVRFPNGDPPTWDTAVRVITDGTWLFVAYDCEDPRLKATDNVAHRVDTPLPGADAVELFVDPGTEGRLYYHFATDRFGQQYDQRGVYNEFGIRRWFVRSRTRLEGRAPGDLLRGQWDPDDGDPRRVMALARAAGAGGAT